MDYESEWSFSWHRQQPVGALSAQLSRPATLTREEQAPAKAQLTSSVSCCVEVASYDLTRRIPPSSPKDSRVSIASRFVIQLSQYSSQPASEVVANINSCNITMYYQALSDAGGVADLLYGLRSLKLLKVLYRNPSADRDAKQTALPAATVINAAAAMQNLQSLTIRAAHCKLQVSDPLLLPLTAGAGGPGYSLKQLDLVVWLQPSITPKAATPDKAKQGKSSEGSRIAGATQQGVERLQHMVASVTLGKTTGNAVSAGTPVLENNSTSIGAADAAGLCVTIQAAQDISKHKASSSNDPHTDHHDDLPAQHHHMPCWTEETAYHATHNRDVRWHHALRQLDGLREFAILGGPVLDLPVQSLPASLKVLKGSYLNIDHSTAAATASAHASRASSSQASPGQSESECVADARPKLYELDLRWCQLSSPSILASNQLLQLNLDSNTWSGGWAAAGAAWPCFKKLTWYSSGEFDTTSRHTSANQQAATILRSMLSSLGSSNCDLLNLSGETLSTAAIARWFSKSVTVEDPSFKDIALAFPHLTDLKVENLPWMTVDLLQPVLHYMKDLQQVSLNISGRGVRIQLDTYRLVLLRDRTNSKTTSRLLKHPDITPVEQKLAEVFPWARVFVE